MAMSYQNFYSSNTKMFTFEQVPVIFRFCWLLTFLGFLVCVDNHCDPFRYWRNQKITRGKFYDTSGFKDHYQTHTQLVKQLGMIQKCPLAENYEQNINRDMILLTCSKQVPNRLWSCPEFKHLAKHIGQLAIRHPETYQKKIAVIGQRNTRTRRIKKFESQIDKVCYKYSIKSAYKLTTY